MLLSATGSLPLDETGIPPNSQVMVGVAKTLSTVVAVQVKALASLQISPLRNVIAVVTTGTGRAEKCGKISQQNLFVNVYLPSTTRS